MFHQAFVHWIHEACTATEAMNHYKGRLAPALCFLVTQLKYSLVAQYDGPHTDHVPVSEAKRDILSLDVLHRQRGQLEHLKLSQIQLLLVDLVSLGARATATFLSHSLVYFSFSFTC